jgi:site-specific DNA-methyltransferase (adenine-specific)
MNTAISQSMKFIDPFASFPEHSIRLYQGDSLAVMAKLPEASFDMIFADPPYFLSNGGTTCQSGQMVSVNKGSWDKLSTVEEMHQFNLTWLAACKRLLKSDGTLWVTGTLHNIYSVGFALKSLQYKILNDIAWHKINPPPNLACRYFTHAHETVIWARKEEKSKHYFNYSAMKEENEGKQMQSVWYIPPPKPFEKRFGKHPAQKPEALLARIITASTPLGALVLDPFCGSGTTGVVCAQLGRKFVGIDQEVEYLEKATQRLNDVCINQMRIAAE